MALTKQEWIRLEKTMNSPLCLTHSLLQRPQWPYDCSDLLTRLYYKDMNFTRALDIPTREMRVSKDNQIFLAGMFADLA